MNGLQKIEKSAVVIGILLSILCGVFGSLSMALAALIGAIFGSINLRLLIWSWHGYIQAKTSAPDAFLMLRFALKYTFLIGGILLFVGALQINLIGFLLGLNNVIFAAAISPLVHREKNIRTHIKAMT